MANYLENLLGQYKNSPMDPEATDDAPIFQQPVVDEDSIPAMEEISKRAPGSLASQADIDKMKQYPLSAAEQAQHPDADELDNLKFSPSVTESDLEKEIQEAGKGASLDILPEESSQPQSKLSKYQQLLNQYNEGNRNLGLLAGANKIAQGFAAGAGGKIDDNMDQIKMLQGMNQEPLKKLQAEDAATMMDPSSDISKYYREQAYVILKKLNPEKDYSGVLENMSASQLQKLPGMKNIGQQAPMEWMASDRVDSKGIPLRFNRRTGEWSRPDGSILRADEPTFRDIARRDALTGNYGYVSAGGGMQVVPTHYENAPAKPVDEKTGKPQEVTYADFGKAAPEQLKEFNKIRDQFNKDMQDSRDVATSVTNMAYKLKPGANNEIDSGLLGGIQTQAAKMAGQKGVLTDQDLVKFAGAGGVEAKIGRIVDGSIFGNMSEDDVKFFKKFAEKMGESLKEDIQNRSQLYTEQGKQIMQIKYPDITDANVAKILGVDKVAPAVQSDKSHELTSNIKNLPPAKPGMVRFQDSQGQIHDIPEKNLEAAKKRDPGLKVLK